MIGKLADMRIRHGLVLGAAEAVHAEGPLQADERTLDARQQPEAERHGQWYPENEVDPARRREVAFEQQDAGNDDVADYDHGDVWRRIVGALVVHLLATCGAHIRDLEVLV